MQAESLQPEAQHWVEQGQNYHNQGDLARAQTSYTRALEQDPQNPDALNLLGVIAHQLHLYSDATALIEKAIGYGSRHRNLAFFHNNAGEARRAAGHLQAALMHYKQAAQLRPKYAAPQYNLGKLYQQQGRHDKAIAAFERTLRTDPKHPKARLAIADSELQLGNFTQGWRNYRARFQTRSFDYPIARELVDTEFKIEQLKDLSDKKLLFVVEQGIGDELFFLRFISGVARKCAEVCYLPSAKLQPVLEQCSNIALVHANENVARFDHIYSICDIALLANVIGSEQIPPPLSLTQPTGIAHPLEPLARQLPRPWIGVSWEAGLRHNNFKSIPINQLAERLGGFQGSILSLQRHPSADALNCLGEMLPKCAVVDCSDLNENLVDMCLALGSLDQYIGVSNTNTHLYASLGKTADVLVTMQADFRWPNAAGESPWYPTARIHRQSPDGSWVDALRDLIVIARPN